MCIHRHFVPVGTEGIGVHVLFIESTQRYTLCRPPPAKNHPASSYIRKPSGCNPLFPCIRSRLWSHPSQPDSRRLAAALRNPALRRHFGELADDNFIGFACGKSIPVFLTAHNRAIMNGKHPCRRCILRSQVCRIALQSLFAGCPPPSSFRCPAQLSPAVRP